MIDDTVTHDDSAGMTYRFDLAGVVHSCDPATCTLEIALTISNVGDDEASVAWSADFGATTQVEVPGVEELSI